MRLTRWMQWVGVAATLGACGILPAPGVAVAVGGAPDQMPSPPPWRAPSDPLPGINNAGIRAYLQDVYDVHIHAHLDVYYNGQPVTVPGGLGIGPGNLYIAPLHTHTPTGLLHLEGPRGKTYTLSQVFTLWGVPLHGAAAWDNGARVADAEGLVLQDHHEVAVVFGTPPATVPVGFNNWLCLDLSLCE